MKSRFRLGQLSLKEGAIQIERLSAWSTNDCLYAERRRRADL